MMRFLLFAIKIRYSRFVRNTSGYSIVELMVAVGLVSLIALGAGTAMFNLNSSQKSFTQKIDANEFVSSLARTFNDKGSCRDLIGGKTTTTTWSDLTIDNFKGFGGKEGESIGAGYTLDGTQALRVESLRWRQKPGGPSQSYSVGGQVLSRGMYEMEIGMTRVENGQSVAMPLRNFEFTAVRSASGVIMDCEGRLDISDACSNMSGATYDPVTGNCVVSEEGCEMRGSFVRSFCSGEPCRAVGNAPSKLNEYTNAYSCPPRSTPMTSFNHTWVSREQIGKKSFVDITNTIQAFVCMECHGISP